MKKIVIVSLVAWAFIMCKSPEEKTFHVETITNKVVLSSQIEWEQLNPARGDKSPKAGTVWGDRKGTVPTGFLVKFIDGFSSPPHIHNVSYRAMVIDGYIHNDDENAAPMWMPSGSFWTQPAGASHITAARGENNLIYVEIDSGPYLVKPIAEAFDNGERPVNVDTSNMVWLTEDDSSSIIKSDKENRVEVAYLWQNNTLHGNLIKLPNGFKGTIKSDGSIFHAIVIQGKPSYKMPNSSDAQLLDAGSYFSSDGNAIHHISSDVHQESVVYVRTDGDFWVEAK